MKILVLITHEKIFNLIAKSLDFIFRKIGINYFFSIKSRASTKKLIYI